MKTIVLAALACLPLAAFSLQPIAAQSAGPTAASQPAATQPITADELVGKYKATCDSVHSFIIKTRCTMTGNSKLTGKYAYLSGYGRRESIEELRYDGGKRLAFRYTLWANPSISPTEVIPEDHPQHTSFLYRDGRSISNLRADGMPLHVRQGSVIISPDRSGEQGKCWLTGGGGDSPLMGFLEADDVRLDEILTGSTSLTLRPTQDLLSGSRCFAIDAITKYGKYTVWIDPDHGYNVARAQMVKNTGDITRGQPLPPGGYRVSTTLQVIRFGKVKEIWVPMEAEVTVAIRSNGNILDHKARLTRMEVQLNPDWTGTKAFEPDDIRDGADVKFVEFMNTRCFWQGGKVLLDPREGDLAEADPELQRLIAEINGQAASQPTTTTSPR